MAKILRTLRNNWKKSVFFAGLSIYGYDFGLQEYKKNLLVREYCKDAVKLGDVPIPIYQSPRHVIVILNPASNKKKAKKEYEKYCAPLLHLSGASVSVFTTDEKNDAISLASRVPENTDALLIAGGDGTVSDVVTGLLRLLNSNPTRKILPIGILPLGRTNSLANQLYAAGDSVSDRLHRYKIMLKATYSILHEVTKNISAMEIENIDIIDGKTLLPVYAVNRLQIGSFRDADSKIDKYWYFGKLRPYASYLFGSYNLDRPVKVELRYTHPCSGCSKCYNDRLDLRQRKAEEPQRRWWHVFVRNMNSSAQVSVTDYSQIENPNCGVFTEEHTNTIELCVSPKEIDNEHVLQVNIGPDKMSFIDFVKEGWKRHSNDYHIGEEIAKKINSQTIILSPSQENVEKESWLFIDNEEYEFKKLKIGLLHNILSVFTLPQS